MKHVQLFLLGLGIGLMLVGWTKLVWQSGFDDGADIAICVKASFEHTLGNAVVAMDKGSACQRAKAYESDPLWLLRRRHG